MWRIYIGQTVGEILPVCGYRDMNLFLGLVHFRLVAPPLQPGVVGPHLVRGAWFSNRLSLEGTGHI
jgi:hypothetical protein